MNQEEFTPIAADIQAHWWAFPIPPSALDLLVSDLSDLAADDVAAAVAAHAADGAERPPTAGQIRRRVAELHLDAPTWDDARTTLVRWRQGAEQRRTALEDWTCPHGACDGSRWVETDARSSTECSCRTAYASALFGLDTLPALIAEFISEHHASGMEVDRLIEGDATVEAQVRDRWREFVGRIVTSRVFAALPAGSAMRRIQAARAEDEERRARGGEPRRLNPLALIEQAA